MRWLAGTMESSCTVKSSLTSGISSGRMVTSISALLEPGEEGRRGMEGEEGGEEGRWSEKKGIGRRWGKGKTEREEGRREREGSKVK